MATAPDPSKRVVEQRLRNRAIEALETLAEGDEGVRSMGVGEDHRVKTFEDEAAKAFAFLVERGCELHASAVGEPLNRPFAQTVAFHGRDIRVETSLALERGGDDAVVTTLATPDGRHQLPELVARKRHEMRKALATHAAETQAG